MALAWVGAKAIEDVHHALYLVRLAPDGQLLAWVIEHRALATTRLSALSAARLLREARTTQAMYWDPRPGTEHRQPDREWLCQVHHSELSMHICWCFHANFC
jgi:hypothetical protein